MMNPTNKSHSLRPPSLRRSWLFSPIVRAPFVEALLQNSVALPDALPDVLVLDLEEMTRQAERPEARARVGEIAKHCRAVGVVSAVRINPLTQDGLDDLQGMVSAIAQSKTGVFPNAIFLPFVESAETMQALDNALTQHEQSLGVNRGTTEMIPTIETALGMVRLMAIATASPRLSACLLSAEDLCADMLAERHEDYQELFYLRQRFLMECRAAKVVAIDCPFNFRQSDAFPAHLAQARQWGFQAKCTVFPEDLAAIHQHFTPDEVAVKAAQKMVQEYDAKIQAGQSAYPLQAPLVNAARRLILRAQAFQAYR